MDSPKWSEARAPVEEAERLASLPAQEQPTALGQLPAPARAQVFFHLPATARAALAAALDERAQRALFEALSTDQVAEVLRELPEESRARLLRLVEEKDRAQVNRLLALPAESAGTRMTTELAAFPPDLSVEEAVAKLRQMAIPPEALDLVFVVDGEGRLEGTLSLPALITAPPGTLLGALARTDFFALPVETDQEEVARSIARYDLPAVPLVDSAGRLVGVVTENEAIDVLEEEQNEDAQLSSAINPDPLQTPYQAVSVKVLLRRRVVWLVTLLIAGLLSSLVVSAFESTLASVMALAFFIPVVTGSGGNTGTQSSTLIIRALATGQVAPRDWAQVLVKELLVGAGLGLTLACVIFLIGFNWPGARSLAPVLATTMVALVLWANLAGALLPMLLRRLGVDPAVAGAPLVSTLVDASGLLIYFAAARVLLPK